MDMSTAQADIITDDQREFTRSGALLRDSERIEAG